MPENIKPLPGWVLIEPEKEENNAVAGVYLPDSSQDVPMRGKIVATSIAPIEWGKIRIETGLDLNQYLPLDVGSIVLFKKFAGQTVKQDGKELRLVEFKDLLAVIE